ncbi:MAG: LCP family protein [Clostridiales bacterium]|nr:LCP family protein [Clostridiales bacterium]
MKALKTVKRISTVLLLVQLVCEALAGFFIWRLDMLPERYFILVVIVLLLFLLLTGLLALKPAESRPAQGRHAAETVKLALPRRILAWLLSLLISAGSVYLSLAAAQVSGTISAVTGSTTIYTYTIGVYVMDDDPAETLSDASDYTFAYSTSYEEENTLQALESIQSELGQEIATAEYDSVVGAVETLYSGENGALVLSQAYADILEDDETYENFDIETRLLYEVTITQEVEDVGDENYSAIEATESVESVTEEPFILYISGSDTRNTTLTTSRSDVNILAVVNPNTKQVLLVNTPRDYYVANPAGNGAKDKLTHCGIYGIDCSVEALAELYGVTVNYYGQINFTGFETLIDAIGGITVYSDTSFTTSGSGVSIDIVEGYNTLDGVGALAFARERHALAGGDNDRGKNQMKVISAVIDKVTGSASTVIANYSTILDSLEGMFITDLTGDDLSSLVKMQLDDMAEWDVVSYAVTGTGGRAETYSMPGRSLYVTYPDEDSVAYASELIDQVLSGEVVTVDEE